MLSRKAVLCVVLLFASTLVITAKARLRSQKQPRTGESDCHPCCKPD